MPVATACAHSISATGPSRLLNKVRGLEQVPLANLDRCCGFGGTFSVKNAEVSSAMLAVKLQDVCRPAPNTALPSTTVASCTWAAPCTANTRA